MTRAPKSHLLLQIKKRRVHRDRVPRADDACMGSRLTSHAPRRFGTPA